MGLLNMASKSDIELKSAYLHYFLIQVATDLMDKRSSNVVLLSHCTANIVLMNLSP